MSGYLIYLISILSMSSLSTSMKSTSYHSSIGSGSGIGVASGMNSTILRTPGYAAISLGMSPTNSFLVSTFTGASTIANSGSGI